MPAVPAVRYLGQFAQTYLILAASDEIILIDEPAEDPTEESEEDALARAIAEEKELEA